MLFYSIRSLQILIITTFNRPRFINYNLLLIAQGLGLVLNFLNLFSVNIPFWEFHSLFNHGTLFTPWQPARTSSFLKKKKIETTFCFIKRILSSTTWNLKFEVYTKRASGRQQSIPLGQGVVERQRVWLARISMYFFYSFFTFVSLSRALLAKRISSCGTTVKNRKVFQSNMKSSPPTQKRGFPHTMSS